MEREKLYEEMELKIILQSSKQSNAKEIDLVNKWREQCDKKLGLLNQGSRCLAKGTCDYNGEAVN